MSGVGFTVVHPIQVVEVCDHGHLKVFEGSLSYTPRTPGRAYLTVMLPSGPAVWTLHQDLLHLGQHEETSQGQCTARPRTGPGDHFITIEVPWGGSTTPVLIAANAVAGFCGDVLTAELDATAGVA